mmetsp:Transcript_48001/g.148157  ORF Transcript_48001/g.148157 Transcript_48001/m.148157 type:complete len:300 (-) Transcript_48001:153-1052(-)
MWSRPWNASPGSPAGGSRWRGATRPSCSGPLCGSSQTPHTKWWLSLARSLATPPCGSAPSARGRRAPRPRARWRAALTSSRWSSTLATPASRGTRSTSQGSLARWRFGWARRATSPLACWRTSGGSRSATSSWTSGGRPSMKTCSSSSSWALSAWRAGCSRTTASSPERRSSSGMSPRIRRTARPSGRCPSLHPRRSRTGWLCAGTPPGPRDALRSVPHACAGCSRSSCGRRTTCAQVPSAGRSTSTIGWPSRSTCCAASRGWASRRNRGQAWRSHQVATPGICPWTMPAWHSATRRRR